jgi:hypothetical protein
VEPEGWLEKVVMSARKVQNIPNDPVPINLVIQYLPPTTHPMLASMYVGFSCNNASNEALMKT